MNAITNKKQLITYILLILAILVIFNIVGRSLFVRFDLTKGNIYSLSKSSKTVIKKLDDRILVKVYFSGDLPGKYANSRRFLQDLLEEYQAYSGGKFHFEFVDPTDNKELQQEAMGYRIPPIQLQVVENDKLEVKTVYMGLALLYNDKNETLPVIQTTEGLEYDITAAIKKLTAVDLKKIGFVSSQNVKIRTNQLETKLRQTFTVRHVSLAQEVTPDINTLILSGVEDSLTMDELYNLDQYLMRGGKLFAGAGKVKALFKEQRGEELKSNLHDLLEHYGLHISTDLLIDRNCGKIQVQQKRGIFSFANAVDYPPIVRSQKFNKENLITKDLEEVVVFFPNEITQSDSSRKFTSLMKTSDKTGVITSGMIPQQMYGSYNMVEGYNLTPDIRNSQMRNPAMAKFPFKSKTIAALIEGYTQSYFSDNPEYNTKENYIRESSGSQILLIADNEFFSDEKAGGQKENQDFILNSIDYLAGDKELLEIRSRGITARPLDELSPGSRKFIKWLNIFLPTLLVLLVGFYRYKRNKDKRKLLEEIYG